jgi:hypothetical protein
MVALTGIEPVLSALRGRRVNQLHHSATVVGFLYHIGRHDSNDVGLEAGSRHSREPSLTVGLLNGSEAQVSSPRVSKGAASTQRLMEL